MAFNWTPIAVSGFNASPPVDDGTVSEANKVKWSTIKTKLADPLNTWAASVDTALDTLLDGTGVSLTGTETLTNKTLTLPQINDTSSDHQYVFAVSELTADRTVTLPLLIAADAFVFASHIQTLAGKTLTSPTITTSPTAAGATWANLGTVTTVDINGGTVDATPIGDTTRSTGDFTYLGVGNSSSSQVGSYVRNTDLTGTEQYGSLNNIIGSSAATALVSSFYSAPQTAVASFTCTDVMGFQATNAVKGAGSTITSQSGFSTADLTSGTNNYGFYGNVSSGTNKWNLYMVGTAANYLAGIVGLGGGPATNVRLYSSVAGLSSADQIGMFSTGQFASAATSTAYGISSTIGTAAASFTCASLAHFTAADGTKGASSAITAQSGFRTADLVNGTTNYGFYGGLSSGANKWNLYMEGSAANKLSGNTFIGDDANSGMSLGLTINQAGNDNEILALKSSDVVHGMTSITETDTFGFLQKADALEGGCLVTGLSEGAYAIVNRGLVTTAVTTKATNSSAPIMLDGQLKTGTTTTSMGANANIAVIRDNGTARFIFDADGDSHQDVGTAWTNFDEHDDVALLDSLSVEVSREDDPIKENFRGFLKYNREALQEAKLVQFNDDGHHFVNMSKLTMAHTGAIRQLGKMLQETKDENAKLRELVTKLLPKEE